MAVLTRLAAVAAAAVLAPSLAFAAAASSTGPAWWRVSDADSEVLIVATPDRLPIYTRWNDSQLQANMRGAKRLIVPSNPSKLSYPYPGNLAFETYPTLANRLDGGLYRRVQTSLDAAEQRLPGYRPGLYRNIADTSRTLDAARLIVDSVTFDWRTGNPVASRAKGYALNAWPDIVVETLDVSAAGLRGTVASVRLSEATQVACLERVVRAMEAGELSVPSYRTAIAAWARGDVERALKRYDYLDTCAYGPVSGVFWSRVIDTTASSLQRALATPGKSVAVIEFDPLLMQGGVLDRLRASGFRIEQISGTGSNASSRPVQAALTAPLSAG